MKNVQVNLQAEKNLIIPKYTKVAFSKDNFNHNDQFYSNELPNDAEKANVLYSLKSHLQEWFAKYNCVFCVLCKLTNK